MTICTLRLRNWPFEALLCILVETISIAALSPAVDVQAAGRPQTQSVRTLALPRSTFPRSASVVGAPASNRSANATTRLHTKTFGALGRKTGYLQRGRWVEERRTFTLQYSASVFTSSDRAASARSDALASLWEIGRPVRIAGLTAPTFEIYERGGHVNLVVLELHGAVETEMTLRSTAITPSALRSVRGAGLRAAAIGRRFARRLSADPSPGPTAVPPYVSPWGTGPVVKSPSLMVADSTMLPAGATLDPGAFRSSHGSPSASGAILHAAFVPAAALARFVQTARMGNAFLFDAAAIYPSAASAAEGFTALDAANGRQSWLRPDPELLSGLAARIDQSAAWHGHGEMLAAIRIQNVVMVVSSTNWPANALGATIGRVAATVPSWLQARGTTIVDTAGDPVRFVGLNWYGAEENDFVIGGLDYRPYQAILSSIKRAGYNVIRLPFSNQLVEQNPIITQHVSANPELSGLRALDIIDRIVNYAGAIGLSIILDDHRSDAGWSSQESGLWYTPSYPDASFDRDWTTMTQRYSASNVVIGADLRNEPHAGATWGSGDPATDWMAAAERAGNAVLAANPHLLVIVEGVQFYGTSVSYWWGGNLMGVATNPVVLQFPDGSSARDHLVYSAHDYGPAMCGGGCPWFNSATTYTSLSQVWEQYWGYIDDDPSKSYAAPLWVGEFGTCNYRQSCVADPTPGSQGQWFSSLVRYLGEKHLGWAYWAVNGTQSTAPSRTYGAVEGFGLLNRDWTNPTSWLTQALRTIHNG